MIKILKNKNIFVIWLIILFALPLITHSIIGKNFHFMADDFGNANMLKEYGFLGAINYWFVNWSGQISGLILTNLFCIITPSDFYGPWVLILILLITQQYGLSKLISIKKGRTSLLYILLVSLALLNVSMDLLPTLLGMLDK